MLGYGTHDHSFTLQAVMDLKGSFGKLEASLENLNTSISSMKGKVDDLVNWKHRILGGAAVIAVVFTVVGVVIGKFGSYVSFHGPIRHFVGGAYHEV